VTFLKKSLNLVHGIVVDVKNIRFFCE